MQQHVKCPNCHKSEKVHWNGGLDYGYYSCECGTYFDSHGHPIIKINNKKVKQNKKTVWQFFSSIFNNRK